LETVLLGLIGTALGKFFPIFGDGSSAAAIVVSLLGIQSFDFMILRRIEQVTSVSLITPLLNTLYTATRHAGPKNRGIGNRRPVR